MARIIGLKVAIPGIVRASNAATAIAVASATPGSIWRVSGTTGAVSLLANVALNGQPNSGPSLGAIAFDQKSKGEKVHGIASAHGAVGAVTAAAYGLAILSVSLKF